MRRRTEKQETDVKLGQTTEVEESQETYGWLGGVPHPSTGYERVAGASLARQLYQSSGTSLFPSFEGS